MAEHSFDLVVIGSGPGGYLAAIRLAQLGRDQGGDLVHLGEELPSGSVVTRAQSLVELDRSSDAHRERTKLAGDAQAAARGRRHEACLASLARVLDQRWGFWCAAHLKASTDGNLRSRA